MASNTLDKVPTAQVPKTVKQFIELDGATKITVTQDSDGTWTITAELP